MWAFHVVLGVDYTRSATFSSFKDIFLQKTGAKACNEGHHDVRRHPSIPCWELHSWKHCRWGGRKRDKIRWQGKSGKLHLSTWERWLQVEQFICIYFIGSNLRAHNITSLVLDEKWPAMGHHNDPCIMLWLHNVRLLANDQTCNALLPLKRYLCQVQQDWKDNWKIPLVLLDKQVRKREEHQFLGATTVSAFLNSRMLNNAWQRWS
jgi:hypothetical protein